MAGAVSHKSSCVPRPVPPSVHWKPSVTIPADLGTVRSMFIGISGKDILGFKSGFLLTHGDPKMPLFVAVLYQEAVDRYALDFLILHEAMNNFDLFHNKVIHY